MTDYYYVFTFQNNLLVATFGTENKENGNNYQPFKSDFYSYHLN